MKFATNLCLFAALALSAPSFAAATTWNVDGSHSSAMFKVRHLAVSNVRGQFSGITGKVILDGTKASTMKANVSADVSTVNTQNKKRDDHLRSADFFDAKKYPKITFSSTKVTPMKGGKFKLTGKLTMHGKTKTVTFMSDGLSKAVKGPGGNMRTGFTATTTLNRKDFGITWNKTTEAGGLVVGHDIQVTVELELIKAASSKSKKG